MKNDIDQLLASDKSFQKQVAWKIARKLLLPFTMAIAAGLALGYIVLLGYILFVL